MNSITFTVPGAPVAKARPRIGQGRAYTPERTKGYEAKVKALALVARQEARQRIWTGPVRVRVTFYVANPTGRPDLDNLCKSLLDPCNGIIFEDDAQVVEIVAVKEQGEPRTEVTFTGGER